MAKAYIGHGAVVLGDVTFGADCSVWYNAVVRADTDKMVIGDRVNIQDCAVLHLDTGYPMTIGNDVTIGHGAILHGCIIEDNTLIGMGSIIMNGAKIGAGSIVAAGALVTQGKEFPAGSLIVGSPAKAIRQLTEEEIQENIHSAVHYVEAAKKQFGE